jgi:hypothetical protein
MDEVKPVRLTFCIRDLVVRRIFVEWVMLDSHLDRSFRRHRPVGIKSPVSRMLVRIAPLITGQVASMFHFRLTY